VKPGASSPPSAEATLVVRSSWVVGAGVGAAEVRLAVQCPRRPGLAPLDECLRCSDCAGLRTDPENHESHVVCLEASPPAPAPRPSPFPPPTEPSQTPISAIMTRDVLCVSADLPVAELIGVLVQRGISGVPVVDAERRPVGVVSKTDLLRLVHSPQPQDPTADPPTLRVRDVMMPVAFCLPANESIAKAAALMAFESVHRIPIVGTRGEIVGLVSPLDVLRWVASTSGFVVGDRARPPGRPDLG